MALEARLIKACQNAHPVPYLFDNVFVTWSAIDGDWQTQPPKSAPPLGIRSIALDDDLS